MKIFFDNVDFTSSSGPNSFGSKLGKALVKMGHQITADAPDIQLSFIQTTQKLAPVVLRLDGIYFNSAQQWQQLNAPIKAAYDQSIGVVFQSHFNKKLTEKYFGNSPNSIVIHNGTDVDNIKEIEPLSHPDLDQYETVWSCASSWRPHKRLSENIRYFLEHAGAKDCLIVAGHNPDSHFTDSRVIYAGNLSWKNLISVYKRSRYFLHLALMDHCPNVVIDARASGCHIICSSSGGTSEIAGNNATIIQDMEWDYEPFELYNPPRLDFSCQVPLTKPTNLDINKVAAEYLSFLQASLTL